MQRHSIPTASYRSFQRNQLEDALEYVAQHPLPVVLKADGLAAGKGVVICEDTPTAITTTRSMLEGAFGEASNTLVIESFLKGTELSVFVLTDGKEYIVLPEAKDYKRIYDGDKGPNTGGMGAVSPVPFFEGEFREKVLQKIIHPTIQGLKAEGIPYIGFIFFGLINQDGEPYVIEYNARLGDPETEAILPRLNEDFLDLCIETVSGKLKSRVAEVKPDVATTVMLVSEGYPGAYEKGRKIEFSTASNVTKDTSIRLHSGTLLAPEGTLTNGGRVLAITALASNAHESRAIAYRAVEEVSFTGKCFRNDIGLDLM
jgi:phosphoribosylamine--glycine ligase